ncbi:hypothetical protein ABPG75_010746 [Micractinium tetrahymenae]
MELRVGLEVEVAGPNDGFAQSWLRGRVLGIEKADRQGVLPKASISYVDFVNDKGQADLEELGARFCYRLRPAQPAVNASLQEFQNGDVVDVMQDDVWWHAVVCDRDAKQGLHVYFTGSAERGWVADPACIRRGKLFVAGHWHPRPLPPGLPKNLLRNAAAAAAGPAAAAIKQEPGSVQAAAPGAGAKGQAGAGGAASKGKGKATAASAAGALPPSASPAEGAAVTVLVRRSARERESRITVVNGQAVLKANMYDLESGERSVFDQELSRELHLGPKAAHREVTGPAATWVAVQHPAKRRKAEGTAATVAAAAAAGTTDAAGSRDENGSDEEGGPASPAKAGAARWNAELLAHNAAVKADARSMQGRRVAFLDEHLEVLRPFIAAEVAASIHAKAAAARATGLPPLPEPVERQPDCLEASLREYQLEGLRWLVSMWDHGTNCILADEMGLGKTLQTISLLSYLKFERGVKGPHLIVVPLSVLPSWMSEFERWSPSMRVVRLHTTDAGERARIKREVLSQPGTFDVAVTTYDMCRSKEWGPVLSRLLRWRYLVLDEGHRIKNEETLLAHAMRNISRQQTLLLTGTPLQNNLHELYALLSYLLPDVFTTSQPFDDAFNLSLHKVDVAQLEAAHAMLQPFMLRRLKQEVELGMPPLVETRINCPLSLMQTFWYRRLLLKDKAMLVQLEDEVAGKVKFDRDCQAYKKLMMLVMQLRKCCNHPFLFPGAEPGFDGETTDESIVQASGKMEVLDRLLKKLKKRGHRVVLFSQFNIQLDILEDYLALRGYKYSRLDGSTNRVQRMIDIKLFNRPGSDMFIYLLNTRAGGLGVNLQTADTVVLFDSDWNPQCDLQAMARVHRIGQTKPVHVYRLCTEGTIEERIQHRAEKKLFLDQMVNRGSVAGVEDVESLSRGEVLGMLRFGADRIFKDDEGRMPTDAELEAIIDRSSTRAAAAVKAEGDEAARAGPAASPALVEGKATAAAFDAQTQPLSSYMFAGTDYSAVDSLKDIGREYWEQFGKGKRERRQNLAQVGEHAVLRQNMYDMQQGEPSVFDREAAGRARPTPKKNKLLIAGRDYEHQDFCQICWDGGELVCCDFCPAAYHAECLGLSPAELASTKRWSCPQHSCAVCARRSQAVAMLFRCEACPEAYCEDHLPAEADITQTCARYAALGVTRLSGACYVRCGPGCAALVAALEAEAAGKQGKKQRRGAASPAAAVKVEKGGAAGTAAVKREPGTATKQRRGAAAAAAAVAVKQERWW